MIWHETARIVTSHRTRALALSVVGLAVLLQVEPCTDDRAGCGPAMTADGAQSCDEWAAERDTSESGRNVAVKVEPITRYIEALESQGLPTSELRAEGPDTLLAEPPADTIKRMEAYVFERAQTVDSGELIEVVLKLADVPFPELPELRAMDAASRSKVLSERKALIEREQELLDEYLQEVGARTLKPVGLVNHLQAWIPSGVMTQVANHPAVVAVYPAWQTAVTLYDHEEVRRATHLSEYWDLGFKGESSSNTCEPDVGYEDIKIAVIEASIASMFFPNRLNTTHPGWADCPSCESRVRAQFDCTGESGAREPCVPWTGEPQNLGAHGTWVTSIAAGDVTQGQDPNTVDPGERQSRTGIAPEAAILYLTVSSTGYVASAIMEAFVLGADVINLSLGIPGCALELTTDCGGLNEVIRTVTLGGTLIVAAAGNENSPTGRCEPSPGCGVCYPALRPEVLSVGNVETAAGVDYDDADLAESSSRGWARVRIGGRYESRFHEGVDVPLVSIATPGNLCGYFANDDQYDDVGRSGTSFAAPVASSAAGLIREEQGAAVQDARMLKSHILSMGDGTDVESATPGVKVGVSSGWGVGRAKFRPFGALRSPKGMAHRSFRIHEGEQVSFYAADAGDRGFPEGTTRWNMGMYLDHPRVDAIPYLLITYWNTCNRERLIAADLKPGLERHAILEQPAIDAACLQIRVYGYSVPDEGVEVFVTDYYHSE